MPERNEINHTFTYECNEPTYDHDISEKNQEHLALVEFGNLIIESERRRHRQMMVDVTVLKKRDIPSYLLLDHHSFRPADADQILHHYLGLI